METNNTPVQKKPPVIPAPIKNFFFYGLKRNAKIKKVAKEYGEVLKIAFIIEPQKDKRIMKAICKEKEIDIDFSEEELANFLKVINKTKEDVKRCKTIFVLLDINAKCVSYQQVDLQG